MFVNAAEKNSYVRASLWGIAPIFSQATRKIRDCASSVFQTACDWTLPLNPVTQRRELHLIPTSIEKLIGAIAYEEMISRSEGEISVFDRKNGHYVEMVQRIGEKLAANSPRKGLDFTFKVVRSRSNNAWCLPGGKIAINIGLIKNMERDTSDYGLGYQPTLEEKIAAVLGHEITHATARHAGRTLEFRLFLFIGIHAVKYTISYQTRKKYDAQIAAAQLNPDLVAKLEQEREKEIQKSLGLFDLLSKFSLSGLSLCSSRSHELEADKFGMHLVAKTHGAPFTKETPRAAIWLMHFFQQNHHSYIPYPFLNRIKNLFSTHPDPEERLKANHDTWIELRSRS